MHAAAGGAAKGGPGPNASQALVPPSPATRRDNGQPRRRLLLRRGRWRRVCRVGGSAALARFARLKAMVPAAYDAIGHPRASVLSGARDAFAC